MVYWVSAVAVSNLRPLGSIGPTGFHLFGPLKMQLVGKRFATDADLN